MHRLKATLDKLAEAHERDSLVDLDIFDIMRSVLPQAVVDAAHVPAFTSSVDAALLLVPKGMHWTVANIGGQATAAVGSLSSPDRAMAYLPAAALCIAAINATMRVNAGAVRHASYDQEDGA